ncbi:MAG: endonuclease [Bacteroidetes bacterium]|nr:endonuclease [Bacteroidota bacterium]
MKKLYFILSILPLFLSAQQIPAGYYNGTQGLTGYSLKSKLHELIIKNYNWHYGDLPNYYGITDLDKYYENDNSILDIYSEIPTGPDAYSYSVGNLIGSSSAEGQGYNREHMMPQSTFNSEYPMYSDLFFVVPTDARINQLRSNYPYGVSTTVPSNVFYIFTNSSKIGKNADTSYYTGRVYEPIDEFKGDIARTMLYFAVRYEGKLGTFNFYPGTTNANDTNPLNGTEERAFDSWFLNLMLQWHNQDPVSQREIDRNNLVYGIQKNRNPFIDHPEWVDMIWNQTPSNTTPIAPQNLTITETSANFAKLNWNNNDTSVIGYKVYVDGVLHGYTSNTNYIVDHLSPNTNYTITIKSYNNSYLDSSFSTTTVSTQANSSFAKDLRITKYIEGTTSSTTSVFNNALEITNQTGHEVNLEGYKLNIQNYNSTSATYYFSNAFQLEGKVAAGETFVIINPYANLACFPMAQAKFVTASTPLTFTGSQYVELSYKGNPIDAVGLKNTSNTNNNVSLYRKATILQPNPIFDISEWQSYPMNYCEGLGSLQSSEVKINNTNSFTLFPNPAENILYIQGKNIQQIKKASIFDVNFRKISETINPFIKENHIDIHHLTSGNYWLLIDEQALKFIKK